MSNDQPFFILGDSRFAFSRYTGKTKVSATRDRMAIWFKEPDYICKISGAENVTLAIQEIERVCEEAMDNAMGPGWVNF